MQFTRKLYIAHKLLFNASRTVKNRTIKFELRDNADRLKGRARAQDERPMDIEDNK